MLMTNYGDLIRSSSKFNNYQYVVYNLLRCCIEDANIKAIMLAFDRVCGKVEKPIIVRNTSVKVQFLEAKSKSDNPEDVYVISTGATVAERQAEILSKKPDRADDGVVVLPESEQPSHMLNRSLDEIGGLSPDDLTEILDNPTDYPTHLVFVASLFSIAQASTGLGGIRVIFDRVDGAVADIIVVENDQDVVLLENYADVAPYNAVLNADGVYEVCN